VLAGLILSPLHGTPMLFVGPKIRRH